MIFNHPLPIMIVPSRLQTQIRTLLVSLCSYHNRPIWISASQNNVDNFVKKHSEIAHRSNSYSTVNITGTRRKQHPLQTSYKVLGNQNVPFYQDMISSYHTLCSTSQFYKICEKPNYCVNQDIIRHKSRKKRHDSENDSDSDADDHLDEDDFEAPAQFKVQTIHVPSLRIDAVISNALGLSRHRLEEMFYGAGILWNGRRLLKKAGKMDEGDYVDAIMEKSDDQLKVKRVKLLKVGSEKTSTDKFIIKVRTWKAPFFIDNPDQWKPES